MLSVGDKIILEIESITIENLDMFNTANVKPTKIYKLKGIPIRFAEDDFIKLIENGDIIVWTV